ncbi:MAG TPA: phosphatase PAP2 family protein [Bacteroidota bacterium]|jgi:undecaprenyl-diphosphatase|nr:phosphatase PAP2 family protein [Bacteroidota bacterium]
MPDALYSLDKSVFYFFNTTIANPFLDAVMPALTDWNKSWIGLSLAAAFLLSLAFFGGKKGRILGVMVLLLIVFSDQFSSAVLKSLFARPRPCHLPLEHLRLLVDCGSGYSFPSTHAVNNSAFAFFLSYHYRRWAWAYGLYAFLMCISRVIVGVHYPSDIIGGAAIGVAMAASLIALYNALSRKYPSLRIAVS